MNPTSFLSFLSAAPSSGVPGMKPDAMTGGGLDFQRALASALQQGESMSAEDSAGVAEGFLQRLRDIVKQQGAPGEVEELDDTVEAAAAAMEQLGERLMRELAALGEREELSGMLSGLLDKLGITGSEHESLMAEFGSVETLSDFAVFRNSLVAAMKEHGLVIETEAEENSTPLEHLLAKDTAGASESADNTGEQAGSGKAEESAETAEAVESAAAAETAKTESTDETAEDAESHDDVAGARHAAAAEHAVGRDRAAGRVDAKTPEHAEARQHVAPSTDDDAPEAPSLNNRAPSAKTAEAKPVEAAVNAADDAEAPDASARTGAFKDALKGADGEKKAGTASSEAKFAESTDEAPEETPKSPRSERVEQTAKVDTEQVVKQKETAAPKEDVSLKADMKLETPKAEGEARIDVQDTAKSGRSEMKAEVRMTSPRDGAVRFAELIDSAKQGGVKKLTVQLQPEHLGRVKVELVDNAGKISARVTVESEAARHALSQGADSLRQQLEAKGIQMSNIDFSFEESGFGQEMKERRELFDAMGKHRKDAGNDGDAAEGIAADSPDAVTDRGLYA